MRMGVPGRLALFILVLGCEPSREAVPTTSAPAPSPAARFTAEQFAFVTDWAKGRALTQERTDSFLGSLYPVELQSEFSPTTETAIAFRVSARDLVDGRTRELLGRALKCSDFTPTQVGPAIAEVPGGVSCHLAPSLRVSLDGEPQQPVNARPYEIFAPGRAPAQPLHFVKRLPTAGPHRIAWMLTLSGPKGMQRLTTRVEQILNVNPGRGTPRPTHDEAAVAHTKQQLQVSALRDVPSLTRELHLRWRQAWYAEQPPNVYARVDIHDAHGRSVPAPGVVQLDRGHRSTTLELDLSSLGPGVHQLVIDLLPDKDLASAQRNSDPYIAAAMRFETWVFVHSDRLDASWLAGLIRFHEATGEGYDWFVQLGPEAAPVVPHLAPILKDPSRWVDLTRDGPYVSWDLLQTFACLRAIGPPATAAVPALRDMLRHLEWGYNPNPSSIVRAPLLDTISSLAPKTLSADLRKIEGELAQASEAEEEDGWIWATLHRLRTQLSAPCSPGQVRAWPYASVYCMADGTFARVPRSPYQDADLDEEVELDKPLMDYDRQRDLHAVLYWGDGAGWKGGSMDQLVLLVVGGDRKAVRYEIEDIGGFRRLRFAGKHLEWTDDQGIRRRLALATALRDLAGVDERVGLRPWPEASAR